MNCEHRNLFLDNRLSDRDAHLFLEHVQQCQDCSRNIRDWRRIQSQLINNTKDLFEKNLRVEAQHVLKQLHSNEPRPPLLRVTAWAGSLVVLLVAGFYYYQKTRVVNSPTIPMHLSFDDATQGLSLSTKTTIRTDTKKRRAHLGQDLLGFAAHTEVEFVRADDQLIHIRLIEGRIAAHVAPRSSPTFFVVEAKNYNIRVVGTVFSVENAENSVVIAVQQGAVRVESATSKATLVQQGSLLRILNNERPATEALDETSKENLFKLLDNTTEDPPVANRNNSLGTANGDEFEISTDSVRKKKLSADDNFRRWQEMIVAGELAGAETAIRTHLRAKPRDLRALSLLGDTLRKGKKFSDAVQTYTKVIDLGTGQREETSLVNRSRYLAATLLQDELNDHSAAVVHLERYILTTPADDPARSAVLLRLAKAKEQTGNTSRAQQLLQQILQQYPKSPAAVEAQHLLNP